LFFDQHGGEQIIPLAFNTSTNTTMSNTNMYSSRASLREVSPQRDISPIRNDYPAGSALYKFPRMKLYSHTSIKQLQEIEAKIEADPSNQEPYVRLCEFYYSLGARFYYIKVLELCIEKFSNNNIVFLKLLKQFDPARLNNIVSARSTVPKQPSGPNPFSSDILMNRNNLYDYKWRHKEHILPANPHTNINKTAKQTNYAALYRQKYLKFIHLIVTENAAKSPTNLESSSDNNNNNTRNIDSLYGSTQNNWQSILAPSHAKRSRLLLENFKTQPNYNKDIAISISLNGASNSGENLGENDAENRNCSTTRRASGNFPARNSTAQSRKSTAANLNDSASEEAGRTKSLAKSRSSASKGKKSKALEDANSTEGSSLNFELINTTSSNSPDNNNTNSNNNNADDNNGDIVVSSMNIGRVIYPKGLQEETNPTQASESLNSTTPALDSAQTLLYPVQKGAVGVEIIDSSGNKDNKAFQSTASSESEALRIASELGLLPEQSAAHERGQITALESTFVTTQADGSQTKSTNTSKPSTIAESNILSNINENNNNNSNSKDSSVETKTEEFPGQSNAAAHHDQVIIKTRNQGTGITSDSGPVLSAQQYDKSRGDQFDGVHPLAAPGKTRNDSKANCIVS
jgi:hypothetical protein